MGCQGNRIVRKRYLLVVRIKDMMIVGDIFDKSSRAVLQESLEHQWYHLGAKFIAHAFATKSMTMKAGEYGEVRLVQALKAEGRALVMLDIAAMAEINGGLRCLVQKFDNMTQLSDDDVIKRDKIKKIREQIEYCRQSSLKE